MTCFFSLYKEFVDDDYRKDRARGYPINEEFLSKRYECMLSQGVLPEGMFPKDIRIILSGKNWPHGRGKW